MHFSFFLSFSLFLYFNYYLYLHINAATASFFVTNAPRFLLPLACSADGTAHDYAQEPATSALFTNDVDEGLDALDGQAERRECNISVPL